MNFDKIPEKYQEDIKKATNLLKNEGCKSIYLFGSMVTGKIHKNSDIDIGISGLPPQRFFKVYAHLDKELLNRVDLVDFDSLRRVHTPAPWGGTKGMYPESDTL
ncbi:MAG: nucleotidyltransferase domain-containing protein [Spirochaetaceae bacterium]|jgi:predicted nucleotidyltransferase|nr:nucleotidyltransferase domain-containing protein [Spirochaetaceae bacterium]